ncbi:SusC/RagA family TonB-linked outer membrane protein [Hymenobacter sp. BT491]|uniref:SusC/RagA family TonB-linked outer membrane protein n=1 Tax=Hymenobacter sp. BT491 TaxID=2766779 RepID=UPI001653BEF7|nr:TonB-dependent receptor [Hymenobacter sp. BT491]MBC6988754.1 TonB-dependent receptor [Hymenobacter sp. BT491]
MTALYSRHFRVPLLTLLLLICASLGAWAQQAGTDISGRVVDEKGSGLPGVTIQVKGTTTGTSTDGDGKFSLKVPAGSNTLVISSVGLVAQTVNIDGRKQLNVTLKEDVHALADVVVVGYGTQKKSQTTGAISSVSSKEIAELPVTNARQALQGRAAGVDVIQSGSEPGGGVTVRIRGRRSINASNDPLYVVDGIPVAGGIDDINPQDIASLEVLKDASATGIYGSRGANGVVLVTTKRGKAGKTVVSYDGYGGFSNPLGKVDVMTGQQFADYKREAYRTAGIYDDKDPVASDKKTFTAIELDGIASGRSTDYQSLLLRTGSIQSHQVGVQGGSEKTQFSVSGNYFQEKGILKTTDFTRYTFRVNLDHQINDRIRIGTSTFGVYSINNGSDSPINNPSFDGFPNPNYVARGFHPFAGALSENPLGKPYDDNGTLIFLPTPDGLRSNPAAEVVPGANVAQTKTVRIFNSVYGEWKIADGLKYRVNFGPDFTNQRFGRFTGTFTNARRLGAPTARTEYGQRFNYTVENILTYNKTFNSVHNLNLTALHSIQRDNYETGFIDVNAVSAESQTFYNLGQAGSFNAPGTDLQTWTLQSFMGRVNYDFKEKYLLTLTGRYDGSSRFGSNNKYGFFPSMALGWNVGDEEFFKGLSWLDQLKLRGSYGSIGNTGISPYQTQSLLARTSYAFGTSPAYGYRVGTLANNDLKWETTSTANIGADFSLWKGRVYGSIEAYQADTRNLLLYNQLPISNGFDRVLQNVGHTRNRGMEVTLTTVNVNTPSGFKWSTDLQFTRNREAIVELFNGKSDDVGNQRFIGQPLQVYYDYQKIGIWQLGEETQAAAFGQKVGQIKIKDQNGDGKIDAVNDRIILGSTIPKWAGGITNRFAYKGFDLSFFVYARVGNMIRSDFHLGTNQLAGRYNNLDINYWTPTNPTNDFPRPNKDQEFPVYNSTLQYFDGTFVKVRNINFGYNFSPGFVESLKITGLRVYASIQQPFIFAQYRSKYKGIDPETSDVVNANQIPSVRQITFGVNAKF